MKKINWNKWSNKIKKKTPDWKKLANEIGLSYIYSKLNKLIKSCS